MRLLVIGDVILDRDLEGTATRLAPEAPVPVVDVTSDRLRPGGAGLAAALAAREGVEVVLAAPDAEDAAAAWIRNALRRNGSRLYPVAGPSVGEGSVAAATRVITRIRCAGQQLVRLDSAGTGIAPADPMNAVGLAAQVARADAVLVADYGAGLAAHPVVRQVLAQRPASVPLVWDPHPRGAEPIAGTTVVTPNRHEAQLLLGAASRPPGVPSGEAEVGHLLRRRWRAEAVTVTVGELGAWTALPDGRSRFAAAPVQCAVDPVGAGDRFAGTVAVALASGATVAEAVEQAVQDVAAWLTTGGAAVLSQGLSDHALEPDPLREFDLPHHDPTRHRPGLTPEATR